MALTEPTQDLEYTTNEKNRYKAEMKEIQYKIGAELRELYEKYDKDIKAIPTNTKIRIL